MPLYIRVYIDYSYEIIFTEGKVKKKRIHFLINPGKHIKLKGQAKKDEIEVNINSLTHILAMETSVFNPKTIERTLKLAELTNKPIITNNETSIKFKEKGLSTKQLRILGFEEEVIDGLRIDPVYSEELQETVDNQTKNSFSSKISDIGKIVNPLRWKPFEKIKSTVRDRSINETAKAEIDTTKPLAIVITFGKTDSVLIPLDNQAITEINKIIPNLEPTFTVLPHLLISETLNLVKGTKVAIILNKSHTFEQVINISKINNPQLNHHTIYAGFDEWVQIEKEI